jgi:hypothetical protein
MQQDLLAPPLVTQARRLWLAAIHKPDASETLDSAINLVLYYIVSYRNKNTITIPHLCLGLKHGSKYTKINATLSGPRGHDEVWILMTGALSARSRGIFEVLKGASSNLRLCGESRHGSLQEPCLLLEISLHIMNEQGIECGIPPLPRNLMVKDL